MWILQIRSNDDGLDFVYTGEDITGGPSVELKALYFDVWVETMARSEVEPMRYMLIDSNNAIVATMWEVD